MSPSIKEAKLLTDKQIIELHDKAAENTAIGTQFYLDELARRGQDKVNKEMLKLTNIMLVVAILALVVSTAAIVVALIPYY